MFNPIEKIKDDTYNRLVLQSTPDAFLLGGYIRDILIGRDSKDRDYAIREDPQRVAERVRETTGGTVVSLKDGYTVRLALKDGVTLDFTRYRKDIKDDLLSRDFTFNAIAFSLSDGLYDPTGGIKDLKEGRVRVVREQNLIEDPLRILRAYRFVGELNGYIVNKTREYLIKYKELLKDVPSERITLEFIKLIESPVSLKALEFIFKDKIISEIIKFKNMDLDNIFNELSIVYTKIKESPKGLYGMLCSEISQGLTYRGLIILDILFSYAEINESRLSLSRKISDRIEKFKSVGSKRIDKDITPDRLYNYFEAAYDVVFETLIVQGRNDVLGEAERFLSIYRQPLIKGGEIMRILNIKEGPVVGEILRKVKKAEFASMINTREEAVRFVESLKQD